MQTCLAIFSYVRLMRLVCMYPNIPHDKSFSAHRKRRNERDKKGVSAAILVELVELVLRNNIFGFNDKTLKRSTVIAMKFTGKIHKVVNHELYLWWRYIDDIFFIWEYRFLDVTVSLIHGKIKTFI